MWVRVDAVPTKIVTTILRVGKPYQGCSRSCSQVRACERKTNRDSHGIQTPIGRAPLPSTTTAGRRVPGGTVARGFSAPYKRSVGRAKVAEAAKAKRRDRKVEEAAVAAGAAAVAGSTRAVDNEDEGNEGWRRPQWGAHVRDMDPTTPRARPALSSWRRPTRVILHHHIYFIYKKKHDGAPLLLSFFWFFLFTTESLHQNPGALFYFSAGRGYPTRQESRARVVGSGQATPRGSAPLSFGKG